jgi:hypothetical protein
MMLKPAALGGRFAGGPAYGAVAASSLKKPPTDLTFEPQRISYLALR